ncbi:MAG TPA: hypothetical protein EYH31_11610 [Anaerolineae bacterium]|nr:hypothetical protein [Anaerolineae bacterium]
MSVQHIYLSPHPGDAVLSCGGRIATQVIARQQNVLVLTVFAGRPDYINLSDVAREIHARWGHPSDPVGQRLAEEADALHVLRIASRQGDAVSALYREDPRSDRWLYASRAALFGPLAPSDRELAVELAGDIATLAGPPDQCHLYAPLAIGEYVDHQVVRRAAEILLDEGYLVWFYEDLPYAAQDGHLLEQALARPSRVTWAGQLQTMDDAALTAKQAAIACYHSPFWLWPMGTDILTLVIQHNRQAGTPGPAAERYWVQQEARPRPRPRLPRPLLGRPE